MNNRDDGSFKAKVEAFVVRVPSGRVVTYGQVAAEVGAPRAARAVGTSLATLDERSARVVPWHRVINGQGRVSGGESHRGRVQRALLETEGVAFDPRARVDLARYRWIPDEPPDESG